MPPETGRHIVPAFVCLCNMTNLFINQIPANKFPQTATTKPHHLPEAAYLQALESFVAVCYTVA